MLISPKTVNDEGMAMAIWPITQETCHKQDCDGGELGRSGNSKTTEV